jgi:phosphoenolpyruvate-protein phosphotransferase
MEVHEDSTGPQGMDGERGVEARMKSGDNQPHGRTKGRTTMTAKLRGETRFHGLPISGGVAHALTCLFRQGPRDEDVPDYAVSGEGIGHEKARLDRARAAVLMHLDTLRNVVAERVGPTEAEIFSAQAMILDDPTIGREMAEAIEAGHNAEWAVLRTFDAFESRMRALKSDSLRQRAADLLELKRRLLAILCEIEPSLQCASEPECARGGPRVIITEELTPALTLEVGAEDIRGIVTARGGITSHAAILARAMGIPAVAGIPHIHDLVACGTEIVVNGDTGEVVVWPTKETVARHALALHLSSAAASEPVEGLRVMANIGLATDVREARAMKAEGIGLYRTELEFTAAGRLLDEREQAARYAAVLEAMDGKPVHFRLLDIGGDKPSPLFDFPHEENPSLGLRGARFLLARPDLLCPQARALARVSAGRTIHVMYPMVIDLEQFRRLRRLFDEATADVPRGRIHHGLMFEVPSACLEAREILQQADFASVGSNDLVQYLFAVDRNNERVADAYSADHPAFWRLLEDLTRTAAEMGRPLSLCGEMAADPRYTARLLALGIRTVSVSARHIAKVRRAASEALARPLSHQAVKP